MKRAILISLMTSAFLVGLAVPDLAAVTNSPQRQKDLVINKIKASNAVQVYAENSHQSHLYIQEASVKEISADDFTILVGEPSGYFKRTTFPDVTLLNTSAKTIKSFALVVESDANKRGYVTSSPNLSIPPNSVYKVTRSHWLKAEKVSVQKGEQFVSVLKEPELDSAKSWIPGAAYDLKVVVGLIVFEDGTRWMLP